MRLKDSQTDKQRDKQTDRQKTNTQTGIQTDRRTYRQTIVNYAKKNFFNAKTSNIFYVLKHKAIFFVLIKH